MAQDNAQSRRLIIISGMSGAGKSIVLNTLEDHDFYCIDNLPISLFNQLAILLAEPGNNFPRLVGIVIDARDPLKDLTTLPASIDLLRTKGVRVEVIFMNADKDILTTRYSETRRKHPLSTSSVTLSDAIDREYELLRLLSEIADLSIDTSHTTIHELRMLVHDQIANKPSEILSIQFLSFGFKKGIPRDADFIFDVRCLPNPHWEKHLRPLTGKDPEVVDFLQSKGIVREMLDQITAFFDKWIPAFEAENRSYLCIAIGCTGGHHRSVYFVEKLSEHYNQLGKHIITRHRELNYESRTANNLS